MLFTSILKSTLQNRVSFEFYVFLKLSFNYLLCIFTHNTLLKHNFICFNYILCALSYILGRTIKCTFVVQQILI